MPTRVSVVVCTHNRAEVLRRSLATLEPSCAVVPDCEVLVIDNCCTDATPEVVQALADRLPVRRIAEPRLGLCHARNTGWRSAAGDIVAYFDDDAFASPSWLEAVLRTFASHPEAGVVGGPVAPLWEAERPAWLSDNAARVLPILDWGTEPHEIPDVRVEWIAGTNMAISRSLLAEVGGFHPELDRVGTNLLSNGDTHLQRRILEAGRTVRYEPAMRVQHLVPPSRLTREWFRRRYYWQGISDSVMRMVDGAPGPARRMRWAMGAVARLLREPGLLRAAMANPDDPDAFTVSCHALIAVGQAAGLLGAARR